MYRENLALLMERFPAIGILASEFSEGEKGSEDLSNWKIPSRDLELLYIYGLFSGVYQSVKKWLDEGSHRRVVFLESEKSVFGAFLQNGKSKELLSLPQVEISLLPSGRGLDGALQSLAEKYPVKTLDVIGLPSRKNSRFRSIRLKLLRKTTLTHALFMDRSHGYQPFLNFVSNSLHLADSFYLNSMKNAFQGIPAIICGAGPSLKGAFETIQRFENRALIFAGGSAVAAFSAAGIWPHFCVAIDPNQEEFQRMKNSFAFEVPFLYSTRIHPGVFQAVNGPFGYLRSGIGGVSELWIEEELGLIEPLIGEKLSSESITVTAIAVAAAQWLGCNPIVLAGLDMAYTGGKRYEPGVGVDEGPGGLKEVRTAADRILTKIDRSGKRVVSAVRWVMESASLSHYAKAHPEIRFINTTEGGIGFEEIEYQPLEKVLEFSKEYDLRGEIHSRIARSNLGRSASMISQKIKGLGESLEKVIGHLKILSGEAPGSMALAEIEMQEEIAYSCLFYDQSLVLSQMLSLRPQEKKWPLFLKLARKYLQVMDRS